MLNFLSFLARLFESTGRAIAVTTASAYSSHHGVSVRIRVSVGVAQNVKVFVKVFKSLYLLNPWMDLVDTLSGVRYWSEVLCCTVTTHIGDLEVKVTDFEILS